MEDSPKPPESPPYTTKSWEKEPLTTLELAAINSSTENEQERNEEDLKEIEIELEQNDEEHQEEHNLKEEIRIKEVEGERN